MAKYYVYGAVSASKFIGEFEANSAEEAEQMAWDSGEVYASVCHQCSDDVSDPEITEIYVEEVGE